MNPEHNRIASLQEVVKQNKASSILKDESMLLHDKLNVCSLNSIGHMLTKEKNTRSVNNLVLKQSEGIILKAV